MVRVIHSTDPNIWQSSLRIWIVWSYRHRHCGLPSTPSRWRTRLVRWWRSVTLLLGEMRMCCASGVATRHGSSKRGWRRTQCKQQENLCRCFKMRSCLPVRSGGTLMDLAQGSSISLQRWVGTSTGFTVGRPAPRRTNTPTSSHRCGM